MIKEIIFKGISFTNFSNKDFNKIIIKKGLFVFPSGPGLASINDSRKYHLSLKKSDFVFFDSGFFVILLRYLKRVKVQKFSGYLFIKFFLNYLKYNINNKILLVDPDLKIANLNKNLFHKMGIKQKIRHYVAPIYNPNSIIDKNLLSIVNKFKPKYILINIAGNIQEILGLYLKNNMYKKSTIICTGAAISFFTKEQAPINNFYDKLYLGWLIRIIFKPKIFLPRYIRSLKLFFLILNNKIKVINK